MCFVLNLRTFMCILLDSASQTLTLSPFPLRLISCARYQRSLLDFKAAVASPGYLVLVLLFPALLVPIPCSSFPVLHLVRYYILREFLPLPAYPSTHEPHSARDHSARCQTSQIKLWSVEIKLVTSTGFTLTKTKPFASYLRHWTVWFHCMYSKSYFIFYVLNSYQV